MAKKANPPAPSVSAPIPLTIAPGLVIRGPLREQGAEIRRLGQRPLVIAGSQTLVRLQSALEHLAQDQGLLLAAADYHPDCCETSLQALHRAIAEHQADLILGAGGGKALDTAKLVAHQGQLPIVTVPTSGATCAAWTALANVYSEAGAFQYDVALRHCPELLILDYDLVQSAPTRTLVAGIGDAIAKWYEASVSSGHASDTLTVAAVQQARVLRDLLFQKSLEALQTPGSPVWREVVDATVLLAGIIGGIGGANCRTVAAHAVHNGLTHLPQTHGILHGEKVAYGILVQLRLEELVAGNQLAVTARQQLLKFYSDLGLPRSLEDLGLKGITLGELRQVAEITCQPGSDIHRLPFAVNPEVLMAALVSTVSLPEASLKAPLVVCLLKGTPCSSTRFSNRVLP
ncbi:iron-containing alcohol dehydrogenase family protein [Synechocystis sp. LKSZ1]|uniref:iron-containing alcohol dehydrogenase family protein n=1 Tax=Synechocystis sp. LKSZ1 TaxID=3144951 RepID=UPI00336BDA5F